MNLSSVQFSGIQPVSSDLTGESLEKYSRNPNVSEADKVTEASRQFEAILVRQILGAARKSVISSGLERESAETGMYQDMVNAQLAEAITQSGGLGLARSLHIQVTRPTHTVNEKETVPEGDLRSVPGSSHNAFRARHD